MRTLNLGILAHVDAGKTSLTERLLYAAGVIAEIGSVDAGSTQTDTLDLERQRGITIKSAVTSFVVGQTAVNLIDTPGHPDFIAEVERVLTVLDGAVLVISAVEGVQAQTRVLMRALRRLGIPVLIFVNKIDRAGAGYQPVLDEIAAKLTPAAVAMGPARRLGTRDAVVNASGPGDEAFTTRLADVLAGNDDALLAAYLDDPATVSYQRLRASLAAQASRGLAVPVFFGSALTGAGISQLVAGLQELLPAASGRGGRPARGTVFKVERGAAGEKVAYLRVFEGTVRVRDRLRFGRGNAGRVTAISVFDRGPAAACDRLTAGQIGKLRGLADVRIGDTLGGPAAAASRSYFAPPILETVVVPDRPADKGALHLALSQLAEQDPLINLRQDDVRQELIVSLYGEVQKEVIQATLASDYGVAAGFRQTTTVCIERPVAAGAAVEVIGQPPNPFLAGVGLRVDPAAPGSGVEFALEIELGALPLAFLKAIRETVSQVLAQGLYGWQVTDCTVTLTSSDYYPRQSHAHGHFDKSMSSTAGDFRNLTPLVLMSALARAGTRVYEPVHRFLLEIPADTFGPLLPLLSRLRAVPRAPLTRGTVCTVEGDIPAARLTELRRQLPGLTRGEGLVESEFGHYQLVTGTRPTRPRSDLNPLDRKEYLLHLTRRTGLR
ncbi:MAG TPA: translation factor GTPase family protein [Streptosporangiaceae bacterium]